LEAKRFLSINSLKASYFVQTNNIIISMPATEKRKSRIPLALQNVFVASQTGIDLGKIKAPTRGLGFKMFSNKEARSHHHRPVAHQKVPQPPKASSLQRMRRTGSTSSSLAGSRTSSKTSASAATATKKVMKEKGTRAKVCRQDLF
jgi:hypothetical protein